MITDGDLRELKPQRPYSFSYNTAVKEAIDIIREISKTKKVIAVTHSLNVAKASDKVFILDNGYIDAYGDHLSLMISSDMYKKLFYNYDLI